jgi:site-specific DNA recombinase
MTKVAIYTRVSSEEQVKGYSLDNQEEKLGQFCAAQGYELKKEHIFREEGESGAKRNRPELDRLIEKSKLKEFDLVLVYKLDRFSRNLKNLLDLIGELEKNGVSFKSITETFDTSTAMGKYMLQNMGSIAELERELIRDRTLLGQIKHKQDGHWVGLPPYGYNLDKETGKLKINEKEANHVRKMYKWLTEGRLSLFKIQQRMNDLKVPTKYDNLGKKKKTNGFGFWNKRTIGRILTNTVYSGVFTYNQYKYLGRVRGEDNLRPQAEWIIIKTPRIVSKNTFNLAQKQIAENKRHSKGNGKYTYLFSKMIKCGVCGYSYGSQYGIGRDNLMDRKRYFCYGSHADIKQDTCKSSSVSESVISIPIWEKLVSVLINPKIAFEQIEKIQKKNTDIRGCEDRLNEIESLLSKTRNKEKRLLDLYLDGKLEKDAFESKLSEIKEDLSKLKSEKIRYENMLISSKEKGLRINSLQALYAKFKEKLENATYEQKKEVIRMFIEKLVITGKNIDIYCNIPYKYSFEGQTTLYHHLNHRDQTSLH